MVRPAQENPITCLGGKGVRVVGEVQGVGTVVCAGEVEGNLDIERLVQIPPEGIVQGDVVTPELVVEAGALLQGQIRMTGEAREPASWFPHEAPGGTP